MLEVNYSENTSLAYKGIQCSCASKKGRLASSQFPAVKNLLNQVVRPRGRAKGWRYRYVPTAVMRHLHAASSGEGTPIFNS